MTDKQLKQAQEYKRRIAQLEGELEKFQNPQEGFSVYLPNCGTLIEDVKQVLTNHLEKYNALFSRL